MKKSVLLFVWVLTLCSCSNQAEQKQYADTEKEIGQVSDTTIGRKDITGEIAGSAYRKRATGYFVIVGNDTSGFMPVFSESKDDHRIDISLNLPYSCITETYFQRLSELKLILPLVSTEFNLDSLNTMSIGRLILTGDLAIVITEAYKNRFGENEKITPADYRKVSDFLLETKLAGDLNELFGPYSVSVESVIIEKAFFTAKEELMRNSRLVRDTNEIPERILDCITWVKFRNN